MKGEGQKVCRRTCCRLRCSVVVDGASVWGAWLPDRILCTTGTVVSSRTHGTRGSHCLRHCLRPHRRCHLPPPCLHSAGRAPKPTKRRKPPISSHNLSCTMFTLADANMQNCGCLRCLHRPPPLSCVHTCCDRLECTGELEAAALAARLAAVRAHAVLFAWAVWRQVYVRQNDTVCKLTCASAR